MSRSNVQSACCLTLHTVLSAKGNINYLTAKKYSSSDINFLLKENVNFAKQLYKDNINKVV